MTGAADVQTAIDFARDHGGPFQEYKVNDYLRSRVESIATELKLIFKEEKKMQSSLTDFI